MNGLLLVDKGPGMTSHDVVDRIRRAAGTRRVGHTGTLDPAATGLLVLCLGRATRLSDFVTGMDKVYEGTMRLGLTTDSYDLDGEVVEEKPVPDLDGTAIQAAFDRWTGDIMQTPPMVSAVKVDGVRLYKKARRGEVVSRPPRPVTVHEFDLLSYSPPEARFRVRCSRGTYARALCHEVGQLLGCGATLATLRRTAVGRHSIDAALPVDDFQVDDDVRRHLVPMAEALSLPCVYVNETGLRAVLTGAPLMPKDLEGGCPVDQGWVQVKTRNVDGPEELLAAAQVLPPVAGVTPAVVRPKRVVADPKGRG